MYFCSSEHRGSRGGDVHGKEIGSDSCKLVEGAQAGMKKEKLRSSKAPLKGESRETGVGHRCWKEGGEGASTERRRRFESH